VIIEGLVLDYIVVWKYLFKLITKLIFHGYFVSSYIKHFV